MRHVENVVKLLLPFCMVMGSAIIVLAQDSEIAGTGNIEPVNALIAAAAALLVGLGIFLKRRRWRG